MRAVSRTRANKRTHTQQINNTRRTQNTEEGVPFPRSEKDWGFTVVVPAARVNTGAYVQSSLVGARVKTQITDPRTEH